MMDKALDIVASMVSPGKTWGCFFRKTLSTLLVAAIGAYGFNTYRRFEAKTFEALDLHEAVLVRGLPEKVQDNLDGLMRRNPDLKSVWLYSWYDGRNVLPVAHAGSHLDPFPLGYFTKEHALQIGRLVLGQCTAIDMLIACPIMADNDAYGVLMFEHDPATKYISPNLAAIAHKLTILIYHNHD